MNSSHGIVASTLLQKLSFLGFVFIIMCGLIRAH